VLELGLSVVQKSRDDIVREAKSVDWKVAIACVLKCQPSAPNPWIAHELNMGVPQAVSRNVGRFRAGGGERKASYRDLIQRITE
tara:strand:- start:12 stop:263 length:252 start_codon:yes stop_codon:yes gene_type:complete